LRASASGSLHQTRIVTFCPLHGSLSILRINDVVPLKDMNRFVARDAHRSCLVIPRPNHISDSGTAQIVGNESCVLVEFFSGHLPESDLPRARAARALGYLDVKSDGKFVIVTSSQKGKMFLDETKEKPYAHGAEVAGFRKDVTY
jgi:hypothetical protein